MKHSIAMSHFHATGCKWRGVTPIQSPEYKAKYATALDEYFAKDEAPLAATIQYCKPSQPPNDLYLQIRSDLRNNPG